MCCCRPELVVYFLSSWRCTVIPENLVLLLDGVYSPKMKGANRLKFICHQGRSLVNNFSLCNNWYKSVVLSLIWLHSLVCQIHNKQMSQLVAYSGNICVWVVSCNECGGLTVLATLSQHKESHGSHGNLYEGEQEQCCSVPVGALYGGLRN